MVGVIAGGTRALTTAVEGAEDVPEQAEQDLRAIDVSAKDCVVGIATSGRTPYVIHGLNFARQLGAYTIGLACNRDTAVARICRADACSGCGSGGRERFHAAQAGTATKLILNMLTTATMIRLGKTFGNLMVDLRATNEKLRLRSNRIVRELTGLDEQHAGQLLQDCAGELKTAILVHLSGLGPADARQRLSVARGRLRDALDRHDG